MMPRKLGIIAGGGRLPRHLADKCRFDNRPVFLVLLEGQSDRSIAKDYPTTEIRIGAAGKIIKAMKRQDVDDLVFAGQVTKPSYGELRPDLWAASFLLKNKVFDSGDDGLLSTLIKALEGEGFRVVGADDVDPELLCEEACLTQRSPDSDTIRDIEIGMQSAMDLGSKDLGQAVVCRHGEIVAVEDRSGTDAMLERLVPSHSRGGVLVKCIKPGQERRADLPTIGPSTVNGLSRAGLSGVAVSAGDALILDRSDTVAAANAAGLFILGTDTSHLQSPNNHG